LAISKLRITNFKGIREAQEFDIRPITLFIGPNSSGKSSCIHALAALAQTVKLPTSGRPLVLDDEFAHVHLGRFIEVIHSKSYGDSICIGFDTCDVKRTYHGVAGPRKITAGDRFAVDYRFRSTKRTQDIFLEKAVYEAPDQLLEIDRSNTGAGHAVKYQSEKSDLNVSPGSALLSKLTLTATTKKRQQDTTFDGFFFGELCNQVVNSELSRVLYLGPFRQSPLRRYPTRGASPNEVGAQGENAVTLLANEYVQSKTRRHLKQIGGWLHQLGLASSVEVSRVGKSDLFDVQATLPDGANLPIADLGYGVSQILPVLAQFSFAPEGATLLFEQPELHLHQSAAKQLAGVFVDAAKEKKIHVVAETHSRELFIGLLHQIRLGRIGPDDLAAYTVKREGGRSVFTRVVIEVGEDGMPEVYDPWDGHL
jgi:predicted ATPase